MSKQLFTVFILVNDGTTVAQRFSMTVRAKHILAATAIAQRDANTAYTQDGITATIAGAIVAPQPR